jgi:hypothetical protein
MSAIDTRQRWPSAFQRIAYFIVGTALLSAFLASAFWWGGILGSFVGLLTLPVLALLAIVVAVWAIADVWRTRNQTTRALSIAGVTILGICLSPVLFILVFHGVEDTFTWGMLAAKYPSYVQVIDLATHRGLPAPGKTAWQGAADGTEFEAERVPPYRIAFPLPGGFLNSWQGILYDPSGFGLRTHAKQPDGTPGDLLDTWSTVEACSHMVGRFYVCDFS